VQREMRAVQVAGSSSSAAAGMAVAGEMRQVRQCGCAVRAVRQRRYGVARGRCCTGRWQEGSSVCVTMAVRSGVS